MATMALDRKTPQFGINLHTWMHPGSDPVAEAHHAEQLGFELVTLHRDVLHGTDPSFENWTLLTRLAAHTTRIRVAPMVLALPHRHPSVLAKMTENLDRLSNGRLVLVLGGGGPMNEPTYRALGLAQRSPRDKVERLKKRSTWCVASGAAPASVIQASTSRPKAPHSNPNRAIRFRSGLGRSGIACSISLEESPMAGFRPCPSCRQSRRIGNWKPSAVWPHTLVGIRMR